MNKIILICILIGVFSHVSAEDESKAIIAVGQAEVEREKILIPDANIVGKLSNLQRDAVDTMIAVLRNDFSFYKNIFEVAKTSAPDSDYLNPQVYKQHNSQFLVLTKVQAGQKNVDILFKVFNMQNNEETFWTRFQLPTDDVRQKAHEIADSIYRSIKNSPSIFKSRIVFVSDRTGSRKNIVKELYIMDFDGANVKRLTAHRSIVLSPAISPNGKQIVYSLIRAHKRIKNVDLYLYDLKSRKSRLLSTRKGINSGAVFSSDGKRIYFTMSYTGNTEIYEMDVQTRRTRRVTKHYAEDVDPSISRDGSKLTFLSSRSGKAMIHLLDPSGTEKAVKRIGFVGDFNATPRFSPDGKEIVFSSWSEDRQFDLYRLNSDGTGLVRLTKKFGSNENPSYSNDGQFIVFSSQRVLSRKKAIQNLYIIDREGELIGQITRDFGNCLSPRWSK